MSISRLIGLSFAVFVLAGCSQSEDTVTSAGETDSAAAETAVADDSSSVAQAADFPLEGNYISTVVTKANGELRPLAGESTLRIGFSGDNTIGHIGGCNWTSDTYTLTDAGTIEVAGQGETSMMGCDEDEDAFLGSFLRDGPSIETGEHTITLTSSDGTVIEFLDENAPERRPPLIGTTWELLSVNNARGGSNSSLWHDEVRLRFVDESTLEWFDGCVDVTTPVEVVFGSADEPTRDDVGELIFDTATPASDGCPTVEARDIQELRDLLSGRRTFTVYGTTLSIDAANGSGLGLLAAE